MKLRIFRKRKPNAKPPKRIFRSLIVNFKLRRLRNYIRRLNPKIEEIKTQVSKLLEKPKVQERIRLENTKKLIQETDDFSPGNHERDEMKLIYLSCKLMGKELEKGERKEIRGTFGVLYSESKVEEARNLAKKLIEVIQDKYWDKLGPLGRGKLIYWIDYIGRFQELEEFSKGIELFLNTISTFVENKNWKRLGEKGKKTAVHWFGHIWNYGSPEQAKIFIEILLEIVQDTRWSKLSDSEAGLFIEDIRYMWEKYLSVEKVKEFANTLLKSIQNEKWDKLNQEQKEKVVGTFGHICDYEDFEKARAYLEAVLNLLENEVEFDKEEDLSYKNLLRLTVEKYLKLTRTGEINSLVKIQGIIKDLALQDPDEFVNRSTMIFEGVSRDQFNSLCCELSGENGNLVQMAAECLERMWGEAA